MNSADRFRPLVLWGLVSSRIYDEHQGGDFYLGLTPFFEPFVQENSGKLLDVERLRTYASSILRLPLSDDVAELLIARMEGLGWLKVEAGDSSDRMYRCRPTPRKTAHESGYEDVEAAFDSVLTEFKVFLSDNAVTLASASDKELEEDFLLFLNKTALAASDSLESAVPSGAAAEKVEYWVAKFIAWLNLHDREKFELIQRIAGVALLTEALLEVRSPTRASKQKIEIAVMLDGPFLMEFMGLSGYRLKENAAYVIEKLRKAGASIACFRHSCDEIKDNLSAVVDRVPAERQGPTAEALNSDEISFTLVSNIRGNVEHFVKTLAGVTVLNQKVEHFESNSRFCNERVRAHLRVKMPSQAEIGRKRDADSITLIMRRRQGYETTNLLAVKSLLLTSNHELVRRANDVLRADQMLSQDRTIIGPALHHRVVSGLLFANLGDAEKAESSRRQLLAACAKVVMLRPRIVDGVRTQIRAIKGPDELALVDALLSQPRATEVLMDFAVGGAKAISASNVDEVIRLVKRTAADEVKQEYEKKIVAERKASAQNVAKERKMTDAEKVKREEDILHFNARLTDLEEVVSAVSEAKIIADSALKEQRARANEAAVRVAKRALDRTLWMERSIKFALSVLLGPLFLIPAIFVSHPIAPWLGGATALINIGALNGYLWNKPVIVLSNFFSKFAEAAVRRDLDRLGMSSFTDRLKVDYLHRRAEVMEQ